MLTIFRRHLKDCPHSSRRYRRCRCPIHVEGTLAGEPIRRALDLTSWEAAESLIHEWNSTGKIGGRLAKTETVPKAIALYLADCVARNTQETAAFTSFPETASGAARPHLRARWRIDSSRAGHRPDRIPTNDTNAPRWCSTV